MTIVGLARIIFLSIGLCFPLVAPAWAYSLSAAPLQLPDSATPHVSTDLALSIQGAANLGGFEVELVYDRAQASVASVTLGDLLGKASGCSPAATRCAVSLGPLHLTDRSRVGGYSFGAGSGAKGSGVLAVIHIDSVASGAAPSLTLANALVVDAFGDPISGATLALSVAEQKSYLPLIQKK